MAEAVGGVRLVIVAEAKGTVGGLDSIAEAMAEAVGAATADPMDAAVGGVSVVTVADGKATFRLPLVLPMEFPEPSWTFAKTVPEITGAFSTMTGRHFVGPEDFSGGLTMLMFRLPYTSVLMGWRSVPSVPPIKTGLAVTTAPAACVP
jgi:hypothetical protein